MTFVKIMIVFLGLIFVCYLGLIFLMLRHDKSKKNRKQINFEKQDQYYATLGERITVLERDIEDIKKIVAKQKLK